MTRDELIAKVRNGHPPQVYSDLLKSRTAHYFEQEFPEASAEVYESFCELVADTFNVPPKDVGLIGSAKTAFSLHPNKDFKPFNASQSDFDIVVVSPTAFRELWGEYLTAYYSRSNSLVRDQAFNVFRQFVTTDSILRTDPLHAQWERRVGPLRRAIENKFYFDSTIRFRVYESWKSVEQYHVDGLRTLQTMLREN